MINFNGTLIGLEELAASEFERSYKYGDAVFETMRMRDGKLLFLEDHYFRLMSSMRILRMNIPMNFTMEYFEEEATKLAKKVGVEQARVRLQVMRQAPGRYTPASPVRVAWWMELEPLSSPAYALNPQGLTVELFKDHYVHAGLLSTLKSSNSLPYVLAGIFAQENNFDTVLLLNDKKNIVEAHSGNVFMLRGNVLTTPPLEDGALRGIFRKNLLKWAPELGLEVREASFNPFDLQRADELWTTNTIAGLQWVLQYRKKSYGSEKATEMAQLVERKLSVLSLLE